MCMDVNKAKLGALIKWVNLTFETKINEVVKDSDLTRAQCDILMFLNRTRYENPHNVTQREIEKEFHISNPTVTGLLNRLEAKEFIERVPSQKDGRYKVIVLTDKAEPILKEIGLKLESNEVDILSRLTSEEQECLRSLLLKIIERE